MPHQISEGSHKHNVVASERVVSQDENTLLFYAVPDHGELFVVNSTRHVENGNILHILHVFLFPSEDECVVLQGESTHPLQFLMPSILLATATG